MRGRPPLGRQVIIGGQHVIGFGHRQAGVVDDREIGRGTAKGLDVTFPLFVVGRPVDRDADHLGVARRPFAGQLGHRGKLGRANGRKVARMAEQDAIAVAQPVMEPDGASRAFGGEIGGDVVDADGHGNLTGLETDQPST